MANTLLLSDILLALNHNSYTLMSFPTMQHGQFAVLFVNRKYGHVYDQDLLLFLNTTDSNQTVYAVFDSFEIATDYADTKIAAPNSAGFDFVYLIFNHKEELVANTDTF